MSKRISVEDRLKKDIKRPVDKLFESTTEKTEDESKKVTENTKGAWDLRRQTYYIPEIIIDALQLKKAFENKDISEIVREALIDSIDDKYLTMAEEKHRSRQ